MFYLSIKYILNHITNRIKQCNSQKRNCISCSNFHQKYLSSPCTPLHGFYALLLNTLNELLHFRIYFLHLTNLWIQICTTLVLPIPLCRICFKVSLSLSSLVPLIATIKSKNAWRPALLAGEFSCTCNQRHDCGPAPDYWVFALTLRTW